MALSATVVESSPSAWVPVVAASVGLAGAVTSLRAMGKLKGPRRHRRR